MHEERLLRIGREIFLAIGQVLNSGLVILGFIHQYRHLGRSKFGKLYSPKSGF